MSLSFKDQLAAIKADIDAILAKGDDMADDDTAELMRLTDEYKAVQARADAAEAATAEIAKAAEPLPPQAAPAAKSHSFAKTLFDSKTFKASVEMHTGSAPITFPPIPVGLDGEAGLAQLGVGKADAFGATITTDNCPWIDSPAHWPGLANWLPPFEDDGLMRLVTTGTARESSYEYAQIVGAPDGGAAIVAEGDLKPLMGPPSIEKRRASAFTIAAGYVETNQALRDCDGITSFMDSWIRRCVRAALEAFVIGGTGEGEEPLGILNSDTLAQPFDTDATTTIIRALERWHIQNGSGRRPQAVVMNPADVANLRLQRDAVGNYMLGNPWANGAAPAGIDGVRIVESNAVPKGTALVGDFSSVQVLTRDPLTVHAFEQHMDYAQRNMTYIRAEMRVIVFVRNPREIVRCDIGDTSAGIGASFTIDADVVTVNGPVSASGAIAAAAPEVEVVAETVNVDSGGAARGRK